MRAWAIAVMMFAAVPANADPSPDVCRQGFKAANVATMEVDRFGEVVRKLDAAGSAGAADGEMQSALANLANARAKLLPAVSEFADAINTLAQQFRDCARR